MTSARETGGFGGTFYEIAVSLLGKIGNSDIFCQNTGNFVCSSYTSQILRVKDIALFAATIFNSFKKLDMSAESVLFM